jgi:hypothetical protein
MARDAEAARKAHLEEKEQINLKHEAHVRELMKAISDLRNEKDTLRAEKDCEIRAL